MTKRRKIAVVDCESDPFKRGRIPEPFIWGFYDGSTYEQFTDLTALPTALHNDVTRDIDDFIPSLWDRRIVVYAHNGGKFDYHYLLDYIDILIPIRIINGRLAQFKIGDCEFRDSWNILPVPLAAYQKQKFDYTILEASERYKPHNWKRISDYLYSDCYHLYNVVNAFVDRHGLALTQASASMKAFRKVLKQNKRAIPAGSDLDFYERFKKFYYGGRTEVHKKGIIARPFKSVDLNSAYPWAMLSDHPCSLDRDVYHDPSEISESEHNQCLWSIRAISRGALPYRDADESLFFPNDTTERVYHVTGWEVAAGLATATLEIKEVLEIIVFDETINFSDYILPLWEHRKAAKAAGLKEETLLDKLQMNSLYGKYGSNPQTYKEYTLLDPEVCYLLEWLETAKRGHKIDTDFDGLERYKFAGMLGPRILGARDLTEEQMHFYNVVVAASITGYVRAELWKAACQCKGLIYMDTDSIAAHDVSTVDLGDELGQWDIEGKYSGGAIAGKNMYPFK